MDDLNQLLEGMKGIATINRASYLAHIEAGFSPKEAMTLTVEAMKSVFGMMIAPLMGSQASQPPQ